MQNFERLTDDSIIPPEDLAQFQSLEAQGNALNINAEKDRERSSAVLERSNFVGQHAMASGLAASTVGAVMAGPAGPILGVPLAAAGFAYQKYGEHRSDELNVLAREKEGEAKGVFAEATDLIDIERARKVAESEGVNIVRPEDVG